MTTHFNTRQYTRPSVKMSAQKSPNPPVFPDSLKTTALSRPRPPPIVTKRSLSVDASSPLPIIHDENSRVRKSSSRKNSAKKKEGKSSKLNLGQTIQLKSPSDGIFLTSIIRQET